MKRYFIEEAKCDVTSGGFACGPMGGNVVAMVRYNTEGESKWIYEVEVEGIPNFLLLNEDRFDDLVSENDDTIEDTVKYEISEFEGIKLEEYGDLAYQFQESDNPAIPLVRYLVALVRCSMEELGPMIEMGRGKYADELDIPLLDIEEDLKDE